MEVTTLIAPAKTAYGRLIGRLAKRIERRDNAGIHEILDILRHAHVENGKYLITIYLRSGRSFTGFLDRYQEYSHDEWGADKGFVVLSSAKSTSKHVSYETVTILVLQIEAVLLQNVYGATVEEVCNVADDVPHRFSSLGAQAVAQALATGAT